MGLLAILSINYVNLRSKTLFLRSKMLFLRSKIMASGERFELSRAMHRRYPVMRFRGVRLGPGLAIPTNNFGIRHKIVNRLIQ